MSCLFLTYIIITFPVIHCQAKGAPMMWITVVPLVLGYIVGSLWPLSPWRLRLVLLVVVGLSAWCVPKKP